MGRVGMRRRLELGLAAVIALLLAATLAWPDWIEIVLGAEPDGGDGSLERLLTVLAAVAAIAAILLAGTLRWRRRRAAGRGGAP